MPLPIFGIEHAAPLGNAMTLDQVIPWGRSRAEYELMFSLASTDYAGGVLDCGGGPSSFTAELSAAGIQSISVDPIYDFSAAQIRNRFEEAVERVMTQVHATPQDWVWSYHHSPDDLRQTRRKAVERFLADYEQGRLAGRYITGELPKLNFASRTFGLALCSHFLFLYSSLLSTDFHVQSVLELCRVAREVRVFPLLTLNREKSDHLEAVRSALSAQNWSSEILQVNYELQRGGNQMLRIFQT